MYTYYLFEDEHFNLLNNSDRIISIGLNKINYDYIIETYENMKNLCFYLDYIVDDNITQDDYYDRFCNNIKILHEYIIQH